jgi:hypothetical protein
MSNPIFSEGLKETGEAAVARYAIEIIIDLAARTSLDTLLTRADKLAAQ